MLKQLFVAALEQEIDKLNRNRIRLRIIGDIRPFGKQIAALAQRAEELTARNDQLTLTIAANYGGRWDLMQAIQRMIERRPDSGGGYTEAELERFLSMSYAPEPDLFIRTGGEQRVSNFLLWQLAYSELYFTSTLWPDFDAPALDAAFAWFAQRERRFGRTSEQLLDQGAVRDTARKLA